MSAADARRRAKKHDDTRIQRAYLSRCANIQIPMLAITDIFALGRAAIERDATDAELASEIYAYVQTIRAN